MPCWRSCARLWPRLCTRSSASTLALGLGFVAMGTSRIVLMKLSTNAKDKYDFHPASVNLMAEALKLLFCLVMSARVLVREERCCRELGWPSSASFLAFLKWMVPAFLYFLDSLISFDVMTYLHPAMAVLFSNFVILITAVLFRLVLKRRLSWVQWAALLILFLAIVSLTGSEGREKPAAVHHLHLRPFSAPSNSCLLYMQRLEEMMNSSASASSASPPPGQAWTGMMAKLQSLGVGHMLLILQCFISSMANIYNEKILKEDERENIFVQNSKLYAFGVLFNGLTLVLSGEVRGRTEHCGLFYGHSVYSLVLVPVTAALGLSVAFILKFRDNMFHVLTGQITAVLVTGLSFFLFDFRPSLDFFLQAPVVLLAIFIYNAGKAAEPESRPPPERPWVVNGDASKRSPGDGEDGELLLGPHSDSDAEASL